MNELRFGQCSLAISQRELRVDGALRSTPPRVFDFIVFLVLHRNRVVTIEEIVDAVWSGSPISRAAIHRTLMLARRVLQDSAKAPKLIRTVNKVGFRFIGEISESVDHEEIALNSLTAPANQGRRQPTFSTSTLALLGFEHVAARAQQGGIPQAVFWIVYGELHRRTGVNIVTTSDFLTSLGPGSLGTPYEDRLNFLKQTFEADWIVEGEILESGSGITISFVLVDRTGSLKRGRAYGEDFLLTAISAAKQIQRGLIAARRSNPSDAKDQTINFKPR